ncbi:MAG: GH3 auxin-responsive promoter family protein [Planctomycetota bacterium]
MAMRWTGLIGLGMRAKLGRRAALLRDTAYWRDNASMIQLAELRSLLQHGVDTAFGREHGFARIAVISDDAAMLRAYRESVPIRDWYGFKDQVARMREGAEPSVLWPGLVKHFAQTSGTTAGDKFIPVTSEMFRSNYRSSLDIFAHLMNRGVSLIGLMSGKCLFLGGCSDLKEDEHGITTADLSGLVTPLIRWPLSEIYSPGPEIALIDDWPTKIDRMASLAIDQDVRFISGMPSWGHVLLERVLELARERGEAAETILDIWPNLRVFVHGGVRYGPFRRRIGQVVTGSPDGDIDVRHELYPASEGFIAMQDRPDDAGLRLMSDVGNFYEFVPLESIADDGSIPPETRAYSVGEVERGVRYGVVMTTCAGLWRYHIGDVVEFDDVPAPFGTRVAAASRSVSGTGPPRLRIVGRHRHFINAFGENLIVEHIETAVEAAVQATGSDVGEFTAAPIYPSEGIRAGLELAIETGPLATAAVMSAFADTFDASLRDTNVDYATKRTSDRGMAPPTVTPVPKGTFHAWMASRGKLGGQNKCPRCANHRDFVEGVCSVAGIEQMPHA